MQFPVVKSDFSSCGNTHISSVWLHVVHLLSLALLKIVCYAFILLMITNLLICVAC